MNKRFSLRILLLVMTAICIAFSAYSFVGANWVTMKAVDRIELGMEKAQVREILGDPKSIENGKWVYEVWIGYSDPIRLEFDSSGKVKELSF